MTPSEKEQTVTGTSGTTVDAATDATTEEPQLHDSGIFSQQYTPDEGGVPTEIFCPSCGDEICGSYLPLFRCPHCNILIFRDEDGHVTNYEQQHTCPQRGHTFGEMTDEAPTEFRRFCRDIEQKTEGVMIQLNRFVERLL